MSGRERDFTTPCLASVEPRAGGYNSQRQRRQLLLFFISPTFLFHHPHFVANLGRLLFVASRAAFQLAPNLVLVLPVLLLSRCFPLSRRPLFVSPSARLAQVTSATLCHLLSSFAPLLRSAPSSCPSFAHGLPLHPRCTGCHGAAHLFFYVTLTLRSVDLWMAAAPL